MRRNWPPSAINVLVVGALILGLLAAGIGWALASPVGGSPDDDFHLGSVWCSASAPSGSCERVGATDTPGSDVVIVPVAISRSAICFDFKGDVSAACQRPIVEQGGVGSSRANAGLYPPGFYAFMGLFVGSGVMESVLLMRIVSFTISVLLIGAGVALADRENRRRFLLAAFATLVPLGMYLFASNNPSGVMTAAIVAYGFAATTSIESDDRIRRRWAISLGLISAITALGTRADSGIFLIVVTVVAVVLARARVDAWLRRCRWLFVPLVLSVVVFATTRQTAGSLGGIGSSSAGATVSTVLFDLFVNTPYLWTGSLGTAALGWFDTPMPQVVPFVMVSAVAALIFTGARHVERAKVAAFVVIVAALTMLPAYVLLSDLSFVGVGVQPRYLLPLLPALVATALWSPTNSIVESLTTLQNVAVVVGVTIANAAALHANMRRYVTGTDVRGFDLGHNAEWWWDISVGPLVVWFVGAAGFALATVAAFWLDARSRSSGSPAPSSGVTIADEKIGIPPSDPLSMQEYQP